MAKPLTKTDVLNCPKCGESFSPTTSVISQLAAPLLAEQAKAAELEAQQKAVAATAADTRRLEEQLKQQQQERQEAEGNLEAVRKELAASLRATRKIDEEKANLEVTLEKMHTKISKEERAKAKQLAQEEFAALLRQKDDEKRELGEQLTRVKERLVEAQRQGASGSAQEQGYARQDGFAEILQERFPDDEITSTRRGAAGADVIQRVRFNGRDCGSILWECKRAATWQNSWSGKLAEDARKAEATVGVLVSEVLPRKAEPVSRTDEGMFITGYDSANILAVALRQLVVDEWRVKVSLAGRESSAEKVYDYFVDRDGFVLRYNELERTIRGMRASRDQAEKVLMRTLKQWDSQLDTAAKSLEGIVLDMIRRGAQLPSEVAVTLELGPDDILVLPAGDGS